MERINNFLKKNKLILIILALALFLRLWGITYDLPLTSSVSDERLLMSTSIKMLNEHSVIPIRNGGHTYFPLLHYVHAVGAIFFSLLLFVSGQVSGLIELKESAILSFHNWLLFARLTTCFIGVLSVYLVYLISRQLFKERSIAHMAALLFAISPMHVFLSHFSKIWTPQSFFILLALYAHLRFWQDPNKKITFKIIALSAIFVLLSFAASSIGILSYAILIFIIFIYFFRFRLMSFFKFIFSKWSLLLHGIILAGISLIIYLGQNANFLVPIKRRVFGIEEHMLPVDIYTFKISIFERIGASLFSFFQIETVLFVCLLPAFILLYKKSKKNFYFLLLSILIFYAALNPPLLKATIMRYNSPTIIFMVLPAAFLLSSFLLWIRQKNKLAIFALLFLVVLPALFINIKHNYLLAKNSTRLIMYNWITENLEAKENVYLSSEYFLQDLVPNMEVVSLIREFAPGWYSTRFQYLYNNLPEYLETKGYGAYSHSFTCQCPEDVIKNLEFAYIIVSGEQEDSDVVDICGVKKIDLSNSDLVLSIDDVEINDYTLDQSPPMETYRPLWQAKKKGPSVRIYKIN